MTQTTTQSRTVHPIVRQNYVGRILGCPIPMAVVAFTRLSTGAPMPWWLWLALGSWAFVWPHLAFLYSRRGNLRSREERVLLADAAIVGAAIALTSFETVPMLAMATGIASIMASVGGLRLLLLGMPSLAAGAVLFSLVWPSEPSASAPSFVSTAIAGAGLLVFVILMGLLTHRMGRNFIAIRRRIKEQSEEIETQNEALVEAREEALQAARAKAAFLATMSHEIRTPLNGVLSMTRLLTETPLADEQRDLVRTIRVSGDTLLAVINDILDYSRIESGRMELEEQPLSVSEVVEDALGIVSPRAQEKHIELVYRVAPDVPPVILGDATRLRQVLTNLLGNAVKFTDEGEIVVTVEQAEAPGDGGPAKLEFAVRDTGIGIPADRIGALFQAFSQADASTTRKYGGTGLGLAICKRLANLMGGDVWAESVAGEGSTFRFTIEARVSPEAPPARRPAVAHQRGRVLVVDDNDTGRRALCAQLETWGFDARDKPGAAEALEELETEQAYDLAIVDLIMPEVDGVSLARRIRRSSRHRNLPLVLLSPMQAAEDPDQLFAARVTKPVRQSQLFDAIMEALGVGPATQVIALAGPAPHLLATRAPLRILVADDNPTNRQVAGLVMRRFGYEVEVACDGREAVERVTRRVERGTEPFDLVFMDVHMPEMDGLAATRAIREQAEQQPEAHWPRVVAMTADAMPEDREKCLDAGMDDYVTKPLDFESVQRVLEETAKELGTASRPATERIVARDAEALENAPELEPLPDLRAGVMDWSRLEQLREFDTPDGAVVKAAVSSFVAQVPQRLEEVQAGAEQRDADGLRRSAHALKGAATNIGAVVVGECASRLERAGKDEAFGDAAHLVEDLRTALLHTLVELHAGNGAVHG